ncbi:putative Amino transferase class IV [Trypanosoma vivax]|uniref:Putative branched-chain amino acid aminotransferase n=1 Tax=Trypanosoma vivax (strain Y486) TaxID=1055687 RepID=G0TRZ9_TRYVY|nr:putative branched-chain amino acid aminotransferase [Trypanosoma vivax]KAH8617367.1 putative Amino transferase class IV [Trypanosoma vivax]CCC46723.1 putative branched-chain amino acid aminotransferase [Trypanosoma vivax Y486]
MSFKASQLTIQRTVNAPPLPPLKGVKFGSIFSPHMLLVDSDATGKWGKPSIVPFHNFSMPPQSACLHYALQCFEGMKVYRDSKGGVRLFRPERNCARFLSSTRRLCFPDFDPSELLALIKEFVKVERDYVPAERGYSLYLRPTAIGTAAEIAAAPSSTSRIFLIASPVGPYYSEGLKPVKLLVEEHRRRAWPGGVGNVKLGANYAAPMLVQRQAQERGLHQVLWLGAHEDVQEVGAMNFFCLWRPSSGSSETELITAPLDGTILPGVTRDCVLELARKWGDHRVSERSFTVGELVEALRENRVIECFGCGTAAIVSPVDGLSYKDEFFQIPHQDPAKSITQRVLKEITDIQYGDVEHDWSHLVDI